jgi:hypothetical protein
MIDLLTQFKNLQTYLLQIIQDQSKVGSFIEWEDWFEVIFNPALEQYEMIYQKIRLSSNLSKPAYINYKLIADDAMRADCYEPQDC